MKSFLTIFVMLILTATLIGQQHAIHQAGTMETANVKSHQAYAQSWNDFDQGSGKMLFNAGQDFFGTTIAYMRQGNARVMYGFNVDIMSVSSPVVNGGNSLFSATPFTQSSLVVPLLFTMKFRFLDNPYSKFSPYAITGVGPTMGFRFNSGTSFFNSLSNIQTQLGAGGYLGAGVDMLWMEGWAFSADIRYNVMYFNNSIGFDNQYNGLSFGIGFMRAFGL